MHEAETGTTQWLRQAFTRRGLAEIAYALLAVAVTTVFIGILVHTITVGSTGIIYILPVIVSAIRWGLLPALIAAVASVGSSAFFFYPPIFSFQVHDWQQLVDVVLFTFVAVVTSHLANSLKRHDEMARVSAESERLRDALIGSVSHELRTPLSSILGATTVLCSSPTVMAVPGLATLATVVRDETERLNNHIQNLLDSTRISREGLRPRLEWAEPADIVNAAIDRLRTRLTDHAVEVDLPAELPLTYVDPVLIQQALGQIIDNAAKYSPAGSPIRVTGRLDNGSILLSVSDRGAGLSPPEQERLGERFFRGSRTAPTTTGSGLGVWIATAFLRANGGSLDVKSDGAGRGTVVMIRLPVPPRSPEAEELSNE